MSKFTIQFIKIFFNRKYYFLLFFVFLFSQLNLHGQGEVWHPVGEYGFSESNTDNLRGTIAPDGTPYVVANKPGDVTDFRVFKFNGSHWESLGGYDQGTFSASKFGITVAANGTIYVSVQYGSSELGGRGTRVYKYSESSWTEIGVFWNESDSDMNTEIIIGSDGSPFLFNKDGDYNIKVRKYSGTGTDWVDKGTYSNTFQIFNGSFALASDDTPYLFFIYYRNWVGYEAKVVKHNGTDWVNVGVDFTGNRVADARTGMALNSSNTPYIFFGDNNNGGKGTVLQFDGSNWVAVGTQGFTAGSTDYNSIAFSAGVPYVFFKDAGNSNKATAMKFNGSSWVNVGSAGFSPGTIDRINGAFSYPNTVTVPVVFFKDNNAGGKKSVMKFSQKNITVTSPNGGEYYKPNSSQNITWTSNDVTNVKIEYTTNNGTSWTTVVASTPSAAGTYPWTTPSGEHDQCRVKVSDVDNPTIVLYSDGSDATFSTSVYIIKNVGTGTATTAHLPVYTNWFYNYTQQIYTQAQLDQDGPIKKIVFSVDGDADNSITWDVYLGHTTKTSFDNNDDWIPVSSMTQVFSGDVTFPSGQGYLTVTLPSTFLYNNTDNLVIAVHEKKPGNSNYREWGSFTSGSNTGIYHRNWDTNPDPSNPPTASGRTGNINRITVFIEDPDPSITVTAPNGGENWVVGSLKNITWGYNKVDDVKIEYTTNGGTLWNTIIASTPANVASYAWTIPNEVSADCKVRISDASNASLNDESNAVFSIIPPYITVTAPNGGESWNIGTSRNITWASEMVTNVKIEYTTNNGSSWIEISASTQASAGTYAWTIPHAPSTECKVKISNASGGVPSDESNATFTIPPPGITVTAPNGGENWVKNSQQNITWISYGVTNVKIEYSTNNGSNWIEIVSSTSASAGTYSWTVPDVSSTNCKVKISEAGTGTPNDESNSTFTITSSVVSLKTPNGGESWAATTKNEITWTFIGTENIKIEYTTDNGSNWIEIIASTPTAAGTYLWTVPNTPSSLCKVRISDVSAPTVNDPSNGTFTITEAPPAPANIGGWALQFDGINDYVNTNYTTNLTRFTIECWVKGDAAPTSKANSNGLVHRGSNYEINWDHGDANFRGAAAMNTSGGWKAASFGTLEANVWYHLAATYDGTNLRAYKNGVLISTTAATNPLSATQTLKIGAHADVPSSGGYFAGMIDEVRIWDYARSEASIKRHMNRQHDGNDAGLISYYKMTDGTGTALTDNKGSNHGTLTNGPLWKSSGCFAGPKYGLLFDGTNDYVHVNDANSLDLTTNYTLEAWIKATTFKWLGGIISKYQTSGSNGYFLRLSGNGSYNDLHFDELTTTGLNLQTGIWYHIAAVKSGGTRKLYVNGIEVTLTGTPLNVAANGDEVRIGCDFRERYFHGIIDEVRIWNTARTPAQIQENMMSTLTGYETGLQLYFRNDHLDGTNTYDMAPYANNGALNNFSAPGCWVVSNPYNTWMGGVDENWSTAANWSLGTVPSSIDNIGLYYWSEGGNECNISGNPTVNNLTFSGISNPTLGSNFTVNGTLLLQRDINLSGRTITLGSSGYLNEGTNKFYGNTGSITTTRTLNNISNQNVGGLGFVITSAANLGSTQITRGHAIQTAGDNQGISRFYDVTPTTNTGLNATATYNYHESELNGIEEANLRLFHSTDAGTTWVNMGGTVSAGNNTVSLSGIDGFGRWTLGDVDNPLPVELSSFSAKADKNSVTLCWETKTEVGNYGFEIERALAFWRSQGKASSASGQISNVKAETWEMIGFVAGGGNSNAPKSYSFKDNKSPAGKLVYRLKQIDNDGTFSFSEEIEVEVAIPTEFKLEQNYPNPFNPTTRIEYQLPVNSLVKLELYSITGEKVSTLVNEELEAGYYIITLNTYELRLASGVYLYRLVTNTYSSIKKMVLIK